MTRSILPALAALLLTSAGASQPSAAPVPADRYLDRFVDRSIDPRRDFFGFAVGRWLEDNPIPPSERAWGIAHVVQEETYQRLLAITEGAAANPAAPRGSNAQKIGDFWHAGMDTAAIAHRGFAPLADEFARIEAANDLQGLLDATPRACSTSASARCARPASCRTRRTATATCFTSTRAASGCRTATTTSTRRPLAHAAHRVRRRTSARMFALLGDDFDARARARRHRHGASRPSWPGHPASSRTCAIRTPTTTPCPSTGAGARSPRRSAGGTSWPGQDIRGIDTVVVGQPEFLRAGRDARSAAVRLDDWKTYLRWHLAHAFAAEAGGRFDAEDFRFYGTILNGTPEQRPRWKRVLDPRRPTSATPSASSTCSGTSRRAPSERYEKLTDEVFAAFRERIRELDWMSAGHEGAGAAQARRRHAKVGYPDRWRDYSTLRRGSRVVPGELSCAATCGSADYEIAKLHKPVDRTEWDMTPQTYNAYYNPSNNEIVLPAAVFILPGIADSLVDDAHRLRLRRRHAPSATRSRTGSTTRAGSSTSRATSRAGGRRRDAEEFERRAALIVKQYDAYVAVGACT